VDGQTLFASSVALSRIGILTQVVLFQFVWDRMHLAKFQMMPFALHFGSYPQAKMIELVRCP